MNNTFAGAAKRELDDTVALLRRSTLPEDIYDLEMTLDVIALIGRAQHFLLPSNGRLLDDEASGLVGMPLRLPYATITASYTVPSHGKECGDSPERLIVATQCEFDEHMLSRAWPTDKPALRAFLGQPVIVVFPVGKVITPQGPQWEIHPVGWVLPPELKSRPWRKQDEEIRIISDASVFGGPIILMPAQMRQAYQHDNSMAQQMENVAATEASIMLELLEALACSNVQVRPNRSTPHAVNVRRERDKKLWLYDDWKLTIDIPPELGEGSVGPTARSPQGGRVPPRQHQRRHHFRIYKASGKQVEVKATVVGTNTHGLVDKTYRLRKNLSAANTILLTHHFPMFGRLAMPMALAQPTPDKYRALLRG